MLINFIETHKQNIRFQHTAQIKVAHIDFYKFKFQLLICFRLRASSPPPPHRGLLIWGTGSGAPPPSKCSPYAIIYDSRAETKHTSKVYDAAPLNDRLGELICAVIFVLINHGCSAKLGPLQGFNFFSSIH